MHEQQQHDERFMREALKQAMQAFKKGEVPVGAVLVQSGKVIARGHNQVELLQDATAHAEMLCLTAGSVALQNWRLLKTTLYTTLEPCTMCLGAIILSRIATVVWGAPDIRQGALGSWVDLTAKPHPIHQIETRGGVLQEECAHLMRQFFKQRRFAKEASTDSAS